MKAIKHITDEGISYIDEIGASGFVNFVECNENWLHYRKKKEKLNDQKVHEIRKIDKFVGQRDSCANPCYIEFFTRPFTRFEFDEIAEHSTCKQAFAKLRDEINSLGWTTIDLS
jgi:hypothetical protein